MHCISNCTDDVTHRKIITIRANQKPWLTGKVHKLLRAWDAAFRAGDTTGLATARANLSHGIREAKQQYSNKISGHFSNTKDTWSLWQGIQTLTNYKALPRTCDSDISVTNSLNKFFGLFETQNKTHAQKIPPFPHEQAVCLTPVSVKKSHLRINPRKAAGPDNIPGRVLKDCAEELGCTN